MIKSSHHTTEARAKMSLKVTAKIAYGVGVALLAIFISIVGSLSFVIRAILGILLFLPTLGWSWQFCKWYFEFCDDFLEPKNVD